MLEAPGMFFNSEVREASHFRKDTVYTGPKMFKQILGRKMFVCTREGGREGETGYFVLVSSNGTSGVITCPNYNSVIVC